MYWPRILWCLRTREILFNPVRLNTKVFPTAWLFETYEKLYLVQLNSSSQRCEGSHSNHWWAQMTTLSLKSFSDINNSFWWRPFKWYRKHNIVAKPGSWTNADVSQDQMHVRQSGVSILYCCFDETKLENTKEINPVIQKCSIWLIRPLKRKTWKKQIEFWSCIAMMDDWIFLGNLPLKKYLNFSSLDTLSVCFQHNWEQLS